MNQPVIDKVSINTSAEFAHGGRTHNTSLSMVSKTLACAILSVSHAWALPRFVIRTQVFMMHEQLPVWFAIVNQGMVKRAIGCAVVCWLLISLCTPPAYFTCVGNPKFALLDPVPQSRWLWKQLAAGVADSNGSSSTLRNVVSIMRLMWYDTNSTFDCTGSVFLPEGEDKVVCAKSALQIFSTQVPGHRKTENYSL